MKRLWNLPPYQVKNNRRIPCTYWASQNSSFEKSGDMDSALEEYKALADICHGEEARCRYALLLKKQGHFDKTKELFDLILNNARLYPKHYAKTEKQWVKIAQAEVK